MDSLNKTLRDPLLGTNPSFLRLVKHMRMDLSLDKLQRVFVTLFETIKMKKRHSLIMLGKLREGNQFILQIKWQFVVTFEHGTCLHFIQSIGYISLSLIRSTFMIHVTPLSLSKNALSTTALCPGICLV